MGIGVIGTGKCLPVVTAVNTDAFASKTGIRERRILHETSTWMAGQAVLDAVTQSGLNLDKSGLIVGCTYGGDVIFPAIACAVQEYIGADNAGAFDIHANCTGFQAGLSVASSMMTADASLDYAIVFGSAHQSRFVDQSSDIAPYFGDGAGAVVLGRVPDGYGVLSSEIFSNTAVLNAVRLEWGASNYVMDGVEVWKQVVQYQPVAIRRALAKIGKMVEDVDFFIFHQANVRLIEYLMGKMKLPMSKTHITADRYGNTADASLPITLCEAVEKGKIKRGDLVVISGVGAGFIFGATTMRWY